MTSSTKVALVCLALVVVALASGYLIGSTTRTTTTQTTSASQGLHNLIFLQGFTCLGQPQNILPWSVTLSNGETITEPPNGNFSNPTITSSQAAIVFKVPDGNYSFKISPIALIPTNGTVEINNGDEVVTLTQPEICG